MTSIYGRRGSLWSTGARMDDSTIWKGIVRTRDELVRGLDLPGVEGSPSNFSSLLGGNGRIQSGKVYAVLRRRSTQVDWGPIIWSKGQCRRWGFILWLAVCGRMATSSRLLAAGVVDSSECVLCDGVIETEEHFLFQCPYSREVADCILD